MTMETENKKLLNINIVDVIGLLKKDKKQILIWSGVAAVFGVVVAFTTPKEYESTVMLAPEESGSGFSGSISSLASMVGMNMKIGQTGDALYPEIYPDLVSSTDFTVGLFPVTVKTKDSKVKCDYYTYLTEHNKLALLDYPAAALADLMDKMKPQEVVPKKAGKGAEKTPLWLTTMQSKVVKGVKGNISCSVDKKTNVITIKVKDQDPLVAALMADSVKSHLQVSITEYRTKKARVDVDYMQKLFDEARRQYDKARQTYAAYADANQDVLLESYKMKEEDLENDMQLKYNIYTQVVEQMQLAKAKVQERTPAFTVVQSANVPSLPCSKSKASIVLMWLIFGMAIRSVVVMWKNRSLFINA